MGVVAAPSGIPIPTNGRRPLLGDLKLQLYEYKSGVCEVITTLNSIAEYGWFLLVVTYEGTRLLRA